MPALPPVASTFRVDLFSSYGPNARVRDRIFLQYTGASPTAADMTTLANTIATAWGNNMSSAQSNQATLLAVQLTDLASSLGNQVVVSTSKVGTIIAAMVAASTSAVIKFKILRRYRGGHARFYFGGLAASQLASATQLTAATVSGLATDFAAFIAAVETAPPASIGALTHVNVSYFSGFTNKTFPSGRIRPVPTLRGLPVRDAVLSYSVNPLIASQRRRNTQSP